MPRDEYGQKWACLPCIRGHRTAKCNHWDRWMVRVKRPGRPLTRCPHPEKDACECGEEQVMMVEVRRLDDGTCLCTPRESKRVLPTAAEAPNYDPHTGDVLPQPNGGPPSSAPSLQTPTTAQFSSPSSTTVPGSPFTNATSSFSNGSNNHVHTNGGHVHVHSHGPHSHGHGHNHVHTHSHGHTHAHSHAHSHGHTHSHGHAHHHHILPPPTASSAFPFGSQDWNSMIPIQISSCDHGSNVHAFSPFDTTNFLDQSMNMLPPLENCHPQHGTVLSPAQFMNGATHSHLDQPLFDPRLQTEGGRAYSPAFSTTSSNGARYSSCCTPGGQVRVDENIGSTCCSATSNKPCDCADGKCPCEFCPTHPNNKETRARVGELISHMGPQDFQSFASVDEFGGPSTAPFVNTPPEPSFSTYPTSSTPAFSQDPNSRFTYLVQLNDPCSKDSCDCGTACRCTDCAVHNPRKTNALTATNGLPVSNGL